MHFYKKHKVAAFSLIELMIAMAITAVLAAVAIPSYSTYVQASRRSEAINNLLNTQKTYELYYAQNNSYPAANASLPATDTYYKYSSVTTSTTYTLTATAFAAPAPASPQLSDKQNGVACNILSIDNLNDKTPAACWNVL